MGDPIHVIHNESAHRFEVHVDNDTAALLYRREGGTITFVHTRVPEGIARHGIGSELVRTGLEFAKSQGLTVIPLCPFAAAYIRNHAEYLELVAEKFRQS
ncbi:MAG TPA: GNAT family N-acetyltransferase [Bryobacteraceae bacterium]|nr:GNAT family N-acetyltransferase [Bryobacteraceae bacterium]